MSNASNDPSAAPPEFRLPWRRTKLAAFVTGSRADRFWRAVPGYLLTVALGWLLTAYACYWPANHLLWPLDVAVATRALDAITKHLPKTRGLDVARTGDSRILTILVNDPAKDVAKQRIAELTLAVQSDGSFVEKVSVNARGAAGSDPEVALSREIVLFERVPETPAFLFFTTHAVQTPASVHALQKAVTAFLPSLAEAPAVKKGNASIDTGLIEEQARAIGEEIKRFDTIGPAFNWNRRLNGKIQFMTVWAFWIAMLQMGARYWLHCAVERRVRQSKALSPLWDIQSDSLNDELVNDLSTLCGHAQDGLRQRTLTGSTRAPWTHARSAYLELYHAAVAAFKVEGDYKSVPTFVDSQAATLGDERNAGLGFIKYLIWSIPSLGFVGTVVGIGDALLETVNVDSLDVAQAAIAKSMVSSNIGVAFDTTLVALLLSLVAMLCYYLLMQFENLTVYRATSDAVSRFVKPGKAISESALAIELVGAIKNASQAAKRFNSAAASWGGFRRALDELADRLKVARRFNSVQLFLILALLAVLGWQVWRLFSTR